MLERKTSIVLLIVAIVFAAIAGMKVYFQNEALGGAITASILAIMITIWAATEAIVSAIKKNK